MDGRPTAVAIVTILLACLQNVTPEDTNKNNNNNNHHHDNNNNKNNNNNNNSSNNNNNNNNNNNHNNNKLLKCAKELSDGCSAPSLFKSNKYVRIFEPACIRHDVCYECVSI